MENTEEIFKKIESLFKKLEEEGFSRKEILKKFESEDAYNSVPFSVFSNNSLSPLEAIVKYLKENCGLDYKKIAQVLNRNPIPIGITYRNAHVKMQLRLDDSSDEKIPLTIFNKEKLSVLENLVYYLKSIGLKYSKIAGILNRDDRTVWTVYNRAQKKLGEIK